MKIFKRGATVIPGATFIPESRVVFFNFQQQKFPGKEIEFGLAAAVQLYFFLQYG